MIATNPYEQTDFSGGFTDNIITNDPTKCARNDNLLIDNNKKPFQRWGSDLYDYDHPQIPEGSNPIQRLFKLVDESMFFAQNARELYYFTDSWQTLTGLGGNPALGAGDETGHISIAEWQGHLFVADDQGGLPIKLYQDASGVWQTVTAGLPALSLADNFVTATATASLVALANNLRTQMLRHFANTGYVYAPHKAADAVSAGMVGAACTDLPTCITLAGQLIKAYDNHYKDSIQGIVYHQKDTGQPVGLNGAPVAGVQATAMELVSNVAPTDIYECADRLNDLHDKYYSHDQHIVPHAQNKANNDIGANPPGLTRVDGINRGPYITNDRWSALYSWASQWFTVYGNHIADGPGAAFAHSTLADAVDIIPVATPATILQLQSFLFWARTAYWAHESDAGKGAPAYHPATEAGSHQLSEDLDYTTYTGSGRTPPIDPFGGVSLDFEDCVTKIAELATQYNAHVQDMTAHFTTNPRFIINQAPGENFASARYIYAFHFSRTYQVGDVTYEDAGPVHVLAAEPRLPVELVPIGLAGIPTLVSTAYENYDTTNTVVKIFRTENNGNTYYQVGQCAFGDFGVFTDRMSDEVLTSQARLYTTGGVVENDPPPSAKCIHVVESKGYYGNIIEDGVELPNRVRQSVPGDIDACPGSFFDDMEDKVIGISSVNTVPVVFCNRAIYRLEGAFDLLGRGAITHKAIENPGSIGLVSEASIIQIDAGILFAGTDGFYFTDAYSLVKLSKDWNTTYSGLVSTTSKAAKIQATYEPISKRVFWTVQKDPDNEFNDALFVLDLNFPLESPCWTTWSNGDHFRPTSILAWGGSLLRGDSRGYLFLHDADLMTDPYVNDEVAVGLWGTKQVVVDYLSCAFDFGSTAIRKWAAWMQARFEDSDLFLGVSTINDSREEKSLGSIRRRQTVMWGDVLIPWGEPTLLWNFDRDLDRKRRFPANSLRFTTKQMRFTNESFLLKESATIPGPATVDSDLEQVTLDNATYAWLPDCESYFITFAADNYATLYEIDYRSSDTVIYVKDPDATLTDGSQAWKIYGVPKGQYFRMLSYCVHAGMLSKSQLGYKTEAAGES